MTQNLFYCIHAYCNICFGKIASVVIMMLNLHSWLKYCTYFLLNCVNIKNFIVQRISFPHHFIYLCPVQYTVCFSSVSRFKWNLHATLWHLIYKASNFALVHFLHLWLLGTGRTSQKIWLVLWLSITTWGIHWNDISPSILWKAGEYLSEESAYPSACSAYVLCTKTLYFRILL